MRFDRFLIQDRCDVRQSVVPEVLKSPDSPRLLCSRRGYDRLPSPTDGVRSTPRTGSAGCLALYRLYRVGPPTVWSDKCRC